MQLRLVLLSLSLLPLATACGDDGGTHTDSPDARPDGAAGSFAIVPGTQNVPTCSTAQYAVDPAATAGAWSASDGAIDATGKYTAPQAVPSGGDATITYTATTPGAGGPAHATAHLAEAFPQAPVTAATGYIDVPTPFEHTLAISGAHVYAVYADGTSGVKILRSDNSGGSFAAKPTLGIPDLTCVVAAVDPVNPDLLYLAVHHQLGVSETRVSLYVSEDGGATFPTAKRYTIADSILDGLALEDCPDVNAPSADHVVVAVARQNNNQDKSWTGMFPSANRGASIGTGFGTSSDDYYSPSEVNDNHLAPDTVLSNGGQRGPRLASNGTGKLCTSYEVASGAVEVQCSADNGATWSGLTTVGTTTAAQYTTLSMSPSGNVAVSWLQNTASDDRIAVAFSQNSGGTFAASVLAPFDVATFGYTAQPSVQWEGNSILWLQETTAISDQPKIVVNKTCDFGASWGGELPLTDNSDFEGNGIYATGSKILSVGRGLRDEQNRPLSLIQLTP